MEQNLVDKLQRRLHEIQNLKNTAEKQIPIEIDRSFWRGAFWGYIPFIVIFIIVSSVVYVLTHP